MNSLREARNELKQMKIEYSEEEFFKYIWEGSTDVVKMFLEAGMNPNARDNNGWSALMCAIQEDHTEIAKVLISQRR